MVGFAIVAVAFIVVGIPVLSVIGLRGYWMWLRDKQIQGLLEERKLLIEKGTTDLPPLELPQMAWESKAAEAPAGEPPPMPQPLPIVTKSTVRSATRWAGIILLVLGACLVLWHTAEPHATPDEVPLVGLILAVIGLLLLLVARALGRRVYPVSVAYEGDEREGVRPLEITRVRDPLRNLKAGITLVFLAATFVAWEFLTPALISGFRPQLQIALILGGIGLALLVIHFTEGYYTPREGQGQDPEEDAPA